MKLHRRHRVGIVDNDGIHLIRNNNTDTNTRTHEQSKIIHTVWKFTKGTWKAFKTGCTTIAASQAFCFALEPTAIATTIVEYRTANRHYA